MPLDTVTLVLAGDVPIATYASAITRFTTFVSAISTELDPDLEWMVHDLGRGSTMATIRGVGNAGAIEAVVRRYAEVGTALAIDAPLRPYSPPVRRAAGRLRAMVGGRVESIRLETAERDVILRPRPVQKPPVAPPSAPVAQPSVRVMAGAFGAIEGRVQTLTNRGGLRFTLYDTLEDRAVSCYLVEGREEVMRDAWGRLAVVEGWISRDPLTGRPITVRQVSNMKVLPDPPVSGYLEARGISPSLSGLLPEQAIRRLRDA